MADEKNDPPKSGEGAGTPADKPVAGRGEATPNADSNSSAKSASAAEPPKPPASSTAQPAIPAKPASTAAPRPSAVPKPPAKPDPWTSPLLDKLNKRFPGAVTEAVIFRNQPALNIAKERLLEICEFLKSDEGGAYHF